MIIAIMGRSCSGKDTLIQWLCKHKDYTRIITYTTRSPRVHEINGLDYNFVSDEYFQYMKDHHRFIESADYTVADGSIWHYGSQISEVEYKSDTKYLIALTPEGIRNMNQKIPSKYRRCIYLDISSNLALDRALRRDGNTPEVFRRNKADVSMFDRVDIHFLANSTIHIHDHQSIEALGTELDNRINTVISKENYI